MVGGEVLGAYYAGSGGGGRFSSARPRAQVGVLDRRKYYKNVVKNYNRNWSALGSDMIPSGKKVPYTEWREGLVQGSFGGMRGGAGRIGF